MIEINKTGKISKIVTSALKNGKSIGFVPTMGALHYGHVKLIQKAKKENDLVVCSIFVNPLQFNKKEDLANYPNRLLEDKKMLRKVNCDYLFTPQKEDLFPENTSTNFAFGSLGKYMEATYRPGHFEGVAAVINEFFKVLKPTKAYFGEKDYQQLAIIRWLVKEKAFKIEVVACETIRSKEGLALSSRNFRLNEKDLKIAPQIYACLEFCEKSKNKFTPLELAENCFTKLEENFDPEYFTIADEDTMIPLQKWTDSSKPRAFVAANLSGVRLIDNLSLNN